jgi:hypothetical protein
MTIVLAHARVMARRKGMKWCERKNIGAIRDELSRDWPVFPDLIATRDGIQDVDALLQDARFALALHCRACPHSDCRWHGASAEQAAVPDVA